MYRSGRMMHYMFIGLIAVAFVFFRGKSFFFCLRIDSVRALEDDLEACHAAHAAQAVVDCLVEEDPQAVGQLFPRAVMQLVRKADHAVEVKDDRLQRRTGEARFFHPRLSFRAQAQP